VQWELVSPKRARPLSARVTLTQPYGGIAGGWLDEKKEEKLGRKKKENERKKQGENDK